MKFPAQVADHPGEPGHGSHPHSWTPGPQQPHWQCRTGSPGI